MFSGRARVVAVVAHPDDAELMFYGTLRRWRRTGADVTVVVATHGANGVSLTDYADGRRLDVGERPAESGRSYEGSGISVECLGLEDGALRADRHLVSAIEAALVRLRCTALLTHAPRTGNDHQDHLAVAQAALNAATRVRSCVTVLHGQPHASLSTFTGAVLVDVTEYLDDKVAALHEHQTQAGRYYLGEQYTRSRAAGVGWDALPALAASGRSFEALAVSLLLLDGDSGHTEEAKPCST